MKTSVSCKGSWQVAAFSLIPVSQVLENEASYIVVYSQPGNSFPGSTNKLAIRYTESLGRGLHFVKVTHKNMMRNPAQLRP